MCRILYVESKQHFNPSHILKSFARMAKNSTEYQGHGWGCAWWEEDGWNTYWTIRPVWKDNPDRIPQTNRLLVHARSAFRDQGIAIENNMPFIQQGTVFIFNGELHGVRLQAEGRIGAEKIFNFILRFNKGNLLSAVQRAVLIIVKRSSYIRALNFIIADAKQTVLNSLFNEQPDYFTMFRYHDEDRLLVCSEPLDLFNEWQPIANQTLEEIQL
ncbi:MAG: hypothetical protein J7L94_09990 [Caldisericaceae bacterium]|nr:hypothetical protein [Caldisericaceae bacterium]